MEGRSIEISIGLGIDAAAEVIVGVGLCLHLGGKDGEDGIAACDAGVALGGLLYAHLGGVGDCILHTVLHAHSSLSTGAHTHCGRQSYNCTFYGK